MNRFTRYVAERHYLKPSSAYPWLPYEVSKGKVLEDVKHDASNCTVTEYYNVYTIIIHIGRDGDIDGYDLV